MKNKQDPEILFKTTTGDALWYIIGNKLCEHCKGVIEESGVCINVYREQRVRRKPALEDNSSKNIKLVTGFENQLFFHTTPCLREHRRYTLVDITSIKVEILPVSIVDQQPQNTVPHIPRKPSFQLSSNKDVTVFDIHSPEMASENTVDNTVYADTQNIEGASVGVLSEKEKALLEDYYKERGEGEVTSPTINEIRTHAKSVSIEQEERGFIDYNPQTSDLTIEEDERRQQDE